MHFDFFFFCKQYEVDLLDDANARPNVRCVMNLLNSTQWLNKSIAILVTALEVIPGFGKLLAILETNPSSFGRGETGSTHTLSLALTDEGGRVAHTR